MYYDIYPDEPDKTLHEAGCTGIKQEVKRREPFTKYLYSNYQINGWLSPIEDHDLLEICLFNKENINNLMEFVEVKGSDDNYDSLRKIKLYPSPSFLKTSNDLIAKNVNQYAPGKDPYKVYRDRIRGRIKEYVEEGSGTKADARQYYYTIRSRLKI